MKLKFLYNPARAFGPVKYKFFIVIKLTTFLILIGALQLSAASYSQGISITRHNANLETIFKDIKSQTGYTFFYAEKINTTQQNLDVDLKNVSLKEALDYCLKGLMLNYTIVDKTIVIRQTVPDAKAELPDKAINQTIGVRGKVIDDKTQTAMAGVNIYLKINRTVVIGVNGLAD
jgi:hypothetical protein